MTNNILLKSNNLTIGYKRNRRSVRLVAEDISVELSRGELVCLLGPNGAGKSTLMRTIAGMQTPLDGSVWLDGADVHQMSPKVLARRLSVVLTERPSTGMLSAYALVALGRHPYTDWTGKLTAADEKVVQWALTAVDATHLAHRNVNELSDGERQKVMIARALAQEPQLMILDEPTAYLDLPRRVEIMRILRKLAREEGRTILLSTHDLDLALRTADKLWLMPLNDPHFSKGASCLQVGTPEDLVLNGMFEQTFYSAGVSFDPISGSFQMNQQQAGQIDVIGDGLPAIWATRALEREGFAVHSGENGSPICVRVGDLGWEVEGNGRSHSVDSIEGLLTAVGSLNS